MKFDMINLKSGYKMPQIGLGTWQLTGDKCYEIVKYALELGYRHIDTALFYENHKEIAKALKDSSIEREEIFITSKIWRDDLSFEGVKKQTQKILAELEIEYLDLCLVHWPNSDFDPQETFAAFEELVDEGKIRSVGVSNYTKKHLENATGASNVPICVNQVEYHPYLNQEDLLDYCFENSVILTAYSPLAHGKAVNDKTIEEIAEKYEKSSVQVILRWLTQKGIVVIPKTTSKEHAKDNLDIFSFTIDEEDIEKIDDLDKSQRLIDPPFSEFD